MMFYLPIKYSFQQFVIGEENYKLLRKGLLYLVSFDTLLHLNTAYYD